MQFVQKYYNKSYTDAVQMLLDEKIEPLRVDRKNTDEKDFQLLKPN